MERPEIVAVIAEAADRVIANAMKHDPDIGRVTHVDASGSHSPAVLHHACEDLVACAAATGLKNLEAATSKSVKKGRERDVEEAADPTRLHPDAPQVVVRPQTTERGDFKQFVWIGGHRFGLHDPDAGIRAYQNPDGSKKEFWVGLLEIIAVCGKYGGKLQGVIAPASKQEFNLYFPLMRKLEKTLGGRWPEAVTGDKGLSINKIFRFNTRRGIASIFPFRKPHAHITSREQMRYERIDEHGVVRCEHCGGECEQEDFQLVPSGDTVRPIFIVRCKRKLEDECAQSQTVDPEKLVAADTRYSGTRSISNGYRLLIPVPRTEERYYALKAAHKNMERTFHHQRQRYRTIGNDETGKLKRFGIGAHQLRSELARLMEWFRLSIRFGWIGSERRYRKIILVTRRGHRALASVMASRIRRGLQIPYGRQAFRRGWAPTPDIPPPKNL